MAEESTEASGGQSARITVSWLAVVIPLVYGVYETVASSLPLFGG